VQHLGNLLNRVSLQLLSHPPAGDDPSKHPTTIKAPSNSSSPRTAAAARSRMPHDMHGRLSDATQYSHHLAEDGGVLNGGVLTRNRPGNRCIPGVVWNQPDLAVHSLESFDRCLSVNHGRYNVAALGLRLLAHHDYIAVRDGGVNHRVTADSEAEQCPVSDEFLR